MSDTLLVLGTPKMTKAQSLNLRNLQLLSGCYSKVENRRFSVIFSRAKSGNIAFIASTYSLLARSQCMTPVQQ